MTDKRTPTLADRFVARHFSAHEHIIQPKVLAHVQARTRIARRFVLDDDATDRFAKVVRTIPELLIREHQFARAPFDLMWIEFPHWRYWKIMCEGRPDHISKLVDADADHTIGYLIDHNRVNIISGGTVSNPMSLPLLSAPQYDLNTEWPFEDQLRFAQMAGTSRGQLDRYLWGTTALDIPEEHIRLLRSHHCMSIVPLTSRARWTPELVRKWIYGGAGDLRNVIALLLMLNRPTITRYSNAPATHGWIKGKHRPFMSHTTVSIDLDAVSTLRLVGTPAGEAVPRRRHEVRGHYCHDKTAHDFMRIAGCMHDWQAHDEEWTPWPDAPADGVNHWVCAACGGKRWWRAHHERGDAALGFVMHDGYEVTSH